VISVAEALERVLGSIAAPTEAEIVPIGRAGGRTLAADVAALRTQPPFDASAMDGYALRSVDAAPGATLAVIGESAAGRGFSGAVGPGQAVRIFTGAPVPPGADAIVIQEDADRQGDRLTLREGSSPGRFIRPRGLDFKEGEILLAGGATLDAPRLALAAAGPDQIVASNSFALAEIAARAGAEPLDLGIAGDSFPALEAGIAAAREAGTDLLVTLGGASVGEHDLVQSALVRQGMSLGFWRIALRPGKPMLHGRLGHMVLLGLPGNPVSSIVCGLLFVMPAIRRLLGDPEAGADPSEAALLTTPLPANDRRQDYLRATLAPSASGLPMATPHPRQDSSMLSVLARSDALIVRPPHAPAAEAGEPCRIIRLS
jgi:molybdopterin molybdotransferase